MTAPYPNGGNCGDAWLYRVKDGKRENDLMRWASGASGQLHRFGREAFVRVDCAFGHRSTLPHAASRTVPVLAVVLTCAERFDHFRKRATHASPISLSTPGRSRVQTIASLMTMLRNKAPSASETPRRITSPAMARLRVSRSAI